MRSLELEDSRVSYDPSRHKFKSRETKLLCNICLTTIAINRGSQCCYGAISKETYLYFNGIVVRVALEKLLPLEVISLSQ